MARNVEDTDPRGENDAQKVQGDADPHDGKVVNCEKLMNWVTEHKNLGAEHYKKREYAKAVEFYEIAITAIDQTDGLPMDYEDVATVIQAKSQLLSNIANAYYQQALYQRCIDSATLAIARDPNNNKGNFWRAKGYEALKEYLKAIEDVKKLGELTSNLTDADREEWIARLEKKQKAYDETFDERVEDAENRGIEAQREMFNEVVNRYGLQNDVMADEIGEYCTRKNPTAAGLAAIYQMEEDDAATLMRWVNTAAALNKELHG
eukprot:GEMP01072327.1.p1 GENE.GEMP01072327.1~~GEMP01072327.1.p1  ORF type:complete len:263 (+),score=81.77 GEMP01072327.1:77-865(+)